MRTLAYASLRGMAILGLGQPHWRKWGPFICVQKRLGVCVVAELSGYASCCLKQSIFVNWSFQKAFGNVDISWNIWKGHKGAEVFHQV